MIPIITIDGPSGAGKGTVSRMLAETTGFHLLDSGALYRLTALAAVNRGVSPDDEAALMALAAALPAHFKAGAEGTTVWLDGVDVTDRIRMEDIGVVASKVAVIAPVRSALLARQRDFVAAPGLVADGRDMGTVVFPEAGVKIFLTAAAEERAHRRQQQLQAMGQTADFDALLEGIRSRDRRDAERPVAPLKPAPDALQIDCTRLTAEQVWTKIIKRARQVFAGLD